MAVDRKPLNTFGAAVDEAKTMSLAGGELELADSGVACTLGGISLGNLGAVKVHLSVNQIIIGEYRRGVRGLKNQCQLSKKKKNSFMR